MEFCAVKLQGFGLNANLKYTQFKLTLIFVNIASFPDIIVFLCVLGCQVKNIIDMTLNILIQLAIFNKKSFQITKNKFINVTVTTAIIPECLSDRRFFLCVCICLE
jgi:hypothetical protein